RTTDEMIEQGKDLLDFSSRIIVKVPVTEEGIEAIYRLAHVGIPVMATAIFDPLQAFWAVKAGARYVVPYYNHLGNSALEVCRAIQHIVANNTFNHGPKAKLLVASLASVAQVAQCAVEGFSAMTLKASIFDECLRPPSKTLDHLNKFESAWQDAPIS